MEVNLLMPNIWKPADWHLNNAADNLTSTAATHRELAPLYPQYKGIIEKTADMATTLATYIKKQNADPRTIQAAHQVLQGTTRSISLGIDGVTSGVPLAAAIHFRQAEDCQGKFDSDHGPSLTG